MIEQIVTIEAGQDGIDYAWWRPTVVELGMWHFVVRYFCKLPNGKAVTRAEVDVIHSAGCAFLPVWEQGAADWMQGTSMGLLHGQLAVTFAQRIGLPQGLPILFAYDTNVAAADQRARLYGTAAADSCEAAGYSFGVYGDLDVIRLMQDRSQLNWLAGARAWSAPGPNYRPETQPGYELVHVRQVISGSTPNYDRNVALRLFPAWLPHEVQPPIEVEPPITPPTPITPEPYDPSEDDMAGNAPLIKMDKRYNEAFLVGAGTPVWLTGEDVAALKGAGVPVADSAEHPSFNIVAARAGCDTLTTRA